MTSEQRLPLLKIVWGTFTLPLMIRGAWFRAINLPLLALIGATLAWNLTDETTGSVQLCVLYAAYFGATSWLAVRTHRLVLSGSASVGDSRRELRITGVYLASFAGFWFTWVALTSLLGILASLVILMVHSGGYHPVGEKPPEFDPDVQRLIDYAGMLAALPASYYVARFVPLLPAVALEQPWRPGGAWEMSRGNGWRLALVVLGLPCAFSFLISSLTRNGASRVELAFLTITFAVLTSLEVIAMSLAYRELQRPATPPTPPPG